MNKDGTPKFGHCKIQIRPLGVKIGLSLLKTRFVHIEVQPANDRMRSNISEPLDWACAGRILPERNVSSHFIIVGGIFCQNSSKMLGVDHDQMISALAPDRSDQAFNISVLPGAQNDVGRSRIPMARTRALNTLPNARSLSRMRYSGALCQGNASVICRANHSAVGLRVTAVHTSHRRWWPKIRKRMELLKRNGRDHK